MVTVTVTVCLRCGMQYKGKKRKCRAPGCKHELEQNLEYKEQVLQCNRCGRRPSGRPVLNFSHGCNTLYRSEKCAGVLVFMEQSEADAEYERTKPIRNQPRL